MADLPAAFFQELIAEHERQRHGFGLQAGADAESRQVNLTCGDQIIVQVRLKPAAGKLDQATGTMTSLSWEGEGCAISMASASMLSDLVAGLPITDVLARIDHFRAVMRSRGTVQPDEELVGDAVALQGASRHVMRVKCAMLAWVACEQAIGQLGAR